MSFFSLKNGHASRFEELVLTSIREVGHGATFDYIQEKAEELHWRKKSIRPVDLNMALYRLDYLGYIYSWSDDPMPDGSWGNVQKRHFRVQMKGLRLLEAAENRETREDNSGAGFSIWSLLFGPRG